MNIFPKTLLHGFSLLLLSGLLVTPCLAGSTPKVETIAGVEFVFIKGGTYVMGDILSKDKIASPPHKVTVNDLWIGKHEVTFEQYDTFCEATKRSKPDDNGWGRADRPVINTSWQDAIDFADWLSKKSMRKIRLPSEAEWEYAARAGTTTPYWWGNKVEINMANCYGCASQWDKQSTAPIGSFSPNPWGLFDMTGNVYEWCLDTKHIDYENAPTDGSAWVEKKPKKHMSRGGSWFMPPVDMSSFARSWDPTDSRNNTIGIRLVMEP